MLMGIPQRNTFEGTLLTDDRFLRRVAYLYYVDGQTQEAIAEQEFCSRQTVSKALLKAKERRIVRIFVMPEERTGYLRNLARDLRMKFGLDDLILVPGRNLHGLPENTIADDIMDEITISAADYLDQLITDSDVLAVSGGRHIMRKVVRYLKPSKLLSNLQVVPTIGFVKPFASFGDPNLIAYDIATGYGARHVWLPIPAIVKTQEQREQSRALPVVEDAIKLMEQANIVIMGLWPPHTTREESIAKGILSKEHIELLETYSLAVDINHWSFDADGRCINEQLSPPPYYLTGMEIPRLKEKIKQGNFKSILVAGASLAHVPALRAALRAGIANILITDHVTAELLKTESVEKL